MAQVLAMTNDAVLDSVDLVVGLNNIYWTIVFQHLTT